MEEFSLLTSIAVALGLALTGGVLARLAGLSPIVGYLAAGVVISPFTPGYDADVEGIRELAELICEIVGFEGNLAWDSTKQKFRPASSIMSSVGPTASRSSGVGLTGTRTKSASAITSAMKACALGGVSMMTTLVPA